MDYQVSKQYKWGDYDPEINKSTTLFIFSVNTFSNIYRKQAKEGIIEIYNCGDIK